MHRLHVFALTPICELLRREELRRARRRLAACVLGVSSLATLALPAPSHALGLGRIHGTALLSRTLDAKLSLALADGETLEPRCVQVDAFMGDMRLPLVVEVVARGADPHLSVRSQAVIAEPVVSIIATVGCETQQTRRYTLLVEPAPDGPALREPPGVVRPVPEVPTPAPAPAAMVAPSAPALLIALPTSSGDLALPTISPASQAPRVAAEQRRRGAASQTPSEDRRPAPLRARGTSRLSVEPIDLSVPPPNAGLKSSVLLDTQPSATPDQRAALAGLWQSVQRAPEEQVRQGVAFERLAADVKALRQESARVSQELAKAQANQKRQGFIQQLGWLLAACLAGLGLAYAFWRWRTARQRGEARPPWWSPQKPHAEYADSLIPPQREVASEVPRGGIGAAPVAKPEHPSSEPAHEPTLRDLKAALDAEFRGAEASSLLDSVNTSRHAAPSAHKPTEFSLSMPSTGELLTADEVIDVNQQAEFFVSLGQHEHAITLLKEHIEIMADPPPVLYVDLLGLYHQQEDLQAFDELRSRFQEKFNADVPDFESFGSDMRGIENYPRAMDRIVALWPSIKVARVIQESLFRKPDAEQKSFSLQAYRDLLFLHALLKSQYSEQSSADRSQPTPPDFSSTRVRPLSGSGFQASSLSSHGPVSALDMGEAKDSMASNSAAEAPAISTVRLSAPDIPPPSRNIGIDIDLGAFNALDASHSAHDRSQEDPHRDAEHVSQRSQPSELSYQQSSVIPLEFDPPLPAAKPAGKSGAKASKRSAASSTPSASSTPRTPAPPAPTPSPPAIKPAGDAMPQLDGNWIDFDAVTSTFEPKRAKTVKPRGTRGNSGFDPGAP